MAGSVQQLMWELAGSLFLEGAYCRSSGQRSPVLNPATDEAIGEFAHATPAEVDAAVAVANRAQREWWAMSALDRANAMHRIADRMLAISRTTGECLTREMGKPFRESNWEGGASASAFRYYAEIARNEQGRVAGPAFAGQLHMVMKEPLGTIVSIVPFNFPMLLFGWQAAAALAGGNSIIVKPSELTSLTLLTLMEAFDHLPAGLVQVVTGGAEVGQRLVAHEHTHGVAFTGSVPAAQAVARAAAERF
jgi:betaine-aldehyde dehydrogenase